MCPEKLLLESQIWPIAKLQEVQWIKFERLLGHAYNTCEFYRARFKALGLHPKRDFHSLECLQKLPILTKRDIQQNLNKMRTSDPTVIGVELNSTGGSTGRPLNFYQDRNYRQWADAARNRAWRSFPGVSKWPIEAVLWGSVRDVGRRFCIRAAIRSLLRKRAIFLNTFDLDTDAIRRFFKVYNVVRPQILRGYASSLYFIANYLASEQIQVHHPRVIVSSAEVLWPMMRQQISTVFGADIIDSYGCREVSQIATECIEHCGLHIVMENQIVEVIDRQIIVTNLNNLGMPFVRYEVGDMADFIDTNPCSCGRAAHRLMGLMGRNNENISLPGGKTINGEFFEFLFFGIQTVEQFQVIYSRYDEELLVRLKVTNDSEKVGDVVRRRMLECFQFENVSVEFTDRFDKTPTGKFRFVSVVDEFDGDTSRVR